MVKEKLIFAWKKLSNSNKNLLILCKFILGIRTTKMWLYWSSNFKIALLNWWCCQKNFQRIKKWIYYLSLSISYFSFEKMVQIFLISMLWLIEKYWKLIFELRQVDNLALVITWNFSILVYVTVYIHSVLWPYYTWMKNKRIFVWKLFCTWQIQHEKKILIFKQKAGKLV